MNPNHPWYLHRSDVFKAVYKWVKQGITSSKVGKEELFYKYNCVLPSSQKERLGWNHVVDTEVTETLEQLNCLNWWQEATRFHAIKLPQDKSSFCHSISIALWGIPDSKGFVSFLIKTTLTLHSRIWEQRFNPNPVQDSKNEGLKSGHRRLIPEHIFILSNILKRPIIIVSNEDRNMPLEEKHQDHASFYGIYLPLMSKPIDCSKMPIFLAYHNASFYPLIMEVPTDDLKGALRERYSVIFPLVKSDFGMLPVKYLHGSEEMRAGEILQDYLIVKDTDTTLGDRTAKLLFAHTECYALPKDKDVILDYMMSVQHYDPKLRNPFKLLSRPLKIFKPSLRPTHNGGPHQHFQSTGDSIMLAGNQEILNQSVIMDTGANYVPNQNELLHHTTNEPSRLEPNAPEMLVEPMEPLSMTVERCTSCNSYRSSVKTFPLCHECHEQKNEMDKKRATSEYSALVNKSSVLTSVSDQVEKLKNYSVGTSENVIALPTINSKVNNEEEETCTGIATAVGELSTHNNTSGSDDNLVEVSCQSSLNEHNQVNDAPTTCVSPVCEEEVSFPELLCQKCIKILKVHHLSNCNKSCCYNPVQKAHVHFNNSEIDMNRNQDVEMTPNKCSMTSSKEQPEVENNCTITNHDSHLSNDKCGICRTLSMPESPDPRNCVSGKCHLKRTISEPESDKYGNDTANPFPVSLMVTNLTSIDETNHIDVCSGVHVLFPNSEKTVKNEKRQPALSEHFGNEKYGASSYVNKSIGENGSWKAIGQNPNLAKRNESKQKDYHQTMEYFETNFRKEANRCKSSSCSNYGSKQRDGYCNKCFNEMVSDSVHGHVPESFGIDQCDGEDPSMEEDQVDGLDAVVTDACHTMQDVSSSDSSDFLLSESDSDDLV